MELNCSVQKYAWGKKGSDSLVARLKTGSDKDFTIEEVPYAELWMGTHVNGPSTLKKTGESLESVIKEHPEYLGYGVVKTFGVQLPYLFKVLSVSTALSIQVHPDKKNAEKLHQYYPDIYKDPNHKPELAIALTPFEALCGFRPFEEIKKFIQDVPELKNVIGNDISERFIKSKTEEEILKEAFHAVLTNPDKIEPELNKLLHRFKNLDSTSKEKYHAELIERLNKDYRNDPGCFLVYFLNYIKLKPGEALFLGANVPHAYLSGDCVECMACSDNVVRAGLTPKYIDIETLCSMLIYKGENPSEILFKPIIEDNYTSLFTPPVPDFAVAQIKIPSKNKNYSLGARLSGSILIVIEGEARTSQIVLKSGVVIFIPAKEVLEISEIVKDLLMYQAFANV